ncbi:probable cytochrome P450 9f2 [Toxorhynchites rutilus septentrionalis]|uniref:probable cytochrome P450 9f2 n=1 Tax=Toxorhynchites rutilus septentrionalis TaxID=329112 RepID=UPI002479F5C0|nr:probable cytochrome P450 9f2 [Toxorhynchites rutilus septentrionalis]
MEVDLAYVILVATIVGLLYRWLTKNHDYFNGKPVPALAVKPIFGSTASTILRQVSFTGFIKTLYDKYAGVKVFGLFDANTPIFVIRDPELIKKIGVKDFDHFMDHRPIFGPSDSDHPNVLFPKTLFAMTDQKWRNMRATLSPAFTGLKMRQMFELIVECSENMVRFYQNESSQPRVYEMKDVFSRFTNDVIATCAFGIKVDSMRQPDNEFYVNGKKMMAFRRISVMVRMLAYRFIPKIMSKLGIDFMDQEQNTYFSALIKDAVRTRETQGIVRPDMINLLMLARKGMLQHQQEAEKHEGFATVQESEVGKAASTWAMTENEMIAQCLIFFLAGFDTVSTCLIFLSYELALNKEVQEKLYEEILATHQSLEGKSLTYDAIQKMKYMDMVVTESLRMWPPVPTIDRICVRNYELNDGEGLKFTIEKGAGVWFPAHGLQHDPKYYPTPEKFIPERFSDENKGNIIMETYLPFGIGPRNCIGSRFALMEVKSIVYHMLMYFSFERCEQTQVPLQLAKGFLALSPEKGIHIQFRPRKAV